MNSEHNWDENENDMSSVYEHFNNFLKMYDNMIEEAKSMSGDLLSNDYIYLKPVFQEIFELILSTVETNKVINIKEDTDEDYLSE